MIIVCTNCLAKYLSMDWIRAQCEEHEMRQYRSVAVEEGERHMDINIIEVITFSLSDRGSRSPSEHFGPLISFPLQS